jgi:outer membrane receptor protein involved in Fe transport
MAYFLFSQGFRLGGTNSQRAAATGQVPAQYKADSLDNFEIGLKSQWWDNRLTLNVSAYLMKWKDRQLEQGNVGVWWVRGNFNGEGAESKGIEVSGAARLAEGLTLDFSASFGNSELTDDTVYPNGDVVPDGTPTPYAPDTKYWVGIEYTVGGWKPFGGDLWMRFDYTYQSEMFNSLWNARADDEGGVIPSWDFGTAKLGMTLPSDLEVTLTIDNIWNEAGMNWLSDDGRDAEIFGDPRFRETRSLFRPRNIGIGIRKKF